jgi:hypothetical protein
MKLGDQRAIEVGALKTEVERLQGFRLRGGTTPGPFKTADSALAGGKVAHPFDAASGRLMVLRPRQPQSRTPGHVRQKERRNCSTRSLNLHPYLRLEFGRKNIASDSMDVAREFRRYAAHCAEMEQLARDPPSKTEWRRLADSWHRRAEQFMRGCARLGFGESARRGPDEQAFDFSTRSFAPLRGPSRSLSSADRKVR